MTRLLVATDAPDSSRALADYVIDAAGPDDEVYVVNSQRRAGDRRTDDVQAGEAALELVADRLRDRSVPVETRQFVRGNEPIEDILSYADEIDADEIVVGMRDRAPAGKEILGKTPQNVLLGAERPVRTVPILD